MNGALETISDIKLKRLTCLRTSEDPLDESVDELAVFIFPDMFGANDETGEGVATVKPALHGITSLVVSSTSFESSSDVT